VWQSLKEYFVASRGVSGGDSSARRRSLTNTQFWTERTVTNHHVFVSREESLDYLDWRNSCYLFYDQFLPLGGHDGLTILDYGCGPGHDLVGFAEWSKPRGLIGVDISPASLAAARHRLTLHGRLPLQLLRIQDGSRVIPLQDGCVDLIHSSGVLHHAPNPEEILSEFRRILKPHGRVHLMVYNYNSIWLHLYVAYQRQIRDGIDSDLSLAEAFKRSTDGPDCPISRCYRPQEFLALATRCGFQGTYQGAAISLFEMSLLPLRYQALASQRLTKEHREFLKSLRFDEYDRPLYDGNVAGIDATYMLTKGGAR